MSVYNTDMWMDTEAYPSTPTFIKSLEMPLTEVLALPDPLLGDIRLGGPTTIIPQVAVPIDTPFGVELAYMGKWTDSTTTTEMVEVDGLPFGVEVTRYDAAVATMGEDVIKGAVFAGVTLRLEDMPDDLRRAFPFPYLAVIEVPFVSVTERIARVCRAVRDGALYRRVSAYPCLKYKPSGVPFKSVPVKSWPLTADEGEDVETWGLRFVWDERRPELREARPSTHEQATVTTVRYLVPSPANAVYPTREAPITAIHINADTTLTDDVIMAEGTVFYTTATDPDAICSRWIEFLDRYIPACWEQARQREWLSGSS